MALILREEDVRALLSMHDTIPVVEEAFNAQAQGLAMNQSRSRLKSPQGILHILPSAVPAFGVIGLKAYTTFREGVRFVILLFSALDGQLLALVESEWLGAMRTGATSAIATKYLARPESTVVGLIGAGRQAVTQLMGVCAVCSITTAYVYCRRPDHCTIFCDEMTRLLNINVLPAESVRAAVEEVDILITATTAEDPVVHGEWIRPGCHINAIGSNWHYRREIDSQTLQRCACVVTDSLEQARLEAGDLIIPASEGYFDWDVVHELAEVVAGQCPAREFPDDITLYKGLGIALEDIATAAHAFVLAQKKGVGEEIDFLS